MYQYPSMRPDHDSADDEDEDVREAPAPASLQKRVTVPTAVFVTNLPKNVRDDELGQTFRTAGVIREIYRVRSGAGEYNGCAVVTFGSVDAVARALKMAGAKVGGNEIGVKVSEKRVQPRKKSKNEDDGGARIDSLNNRLYPHEVPEAQKDFKKRRLEYPRDHI